MTTKTIDAQAEKHVTARQLLLAAGSILAGAILTAIWSYRFVDEVIGGTILRTFLGEATVALPITSTVAGALFAFVSGIAGTFTACNICAFSALAPMTTEEKTIGKTLQPLLYLAVGLILVSGVYGAIGALWGPSLPQLSTGTFGNTNFPLRLLQSSIVFVLLGAIMIAWGLISLNLIPNPLAAVSYRYPWMKFTFMGGLIGAFLIGRPFQPFRKMFEYAAATHDPLYGAFVFILQAVGNVLIMVLLFLLLRYGAGGRFQRWLGANPRRAQAIMAIAFLTGGAFFVTYWGLRIPAIFDIGWWPM